MAMTIEQKIDKMELEVKEMTKAIKAINPRFTKKIASAKEEVKELKIKIKLMRDKLNGVKIEAKPKSKVADKKSETKPKKVVSKKAVKDKLIENEKDTTKEKKTK